jgi:hypothetical protein
VAGAHHQVDSRRVSARVPIQDRRYHEAKTLLEADPLGRALNFGRPEIHTVRELLDLWPGRLRVLPLPIVRHLPHAYAEGRNTTPEHADGRLTWA